MSIYTKLSLLLIANFVLAGVLLATLPPETESRLETIGIRPYGVGECRTSLASTGTTWVKIAADAISLTPFGAMGRRHVCDVFHGLHYFAILYAIILIALAGAFLLGSLLQAVGRWIPHPLKWVHSRVYPYWLHWKFKGTSTTVEHRLSVLYPEERNGGYIHYQGGEPGEGYPYIVVEIDSHQYAVNISSLNVAGGGSVNPIVPEMALHGSRLNKAKFPSYLVEIALDGVAIGMGFRIGNTLWTAYHVVASEGDYSMCGHRADARAMPIDPKWKVSSWSRGLDFVGIEVPADVWSYLQVSRTKWATPLQNMQIRVYGRGHDGDTRASTGEVIDSKSKDGYLYYRSSTLKGWSGSPILSATGVVGIHQEYDSVANLNRGRSMHIMNTRVAESQHRGRLYNYDPDISDDEEAQYWEVVLEERFGHVLQDGSVYAQDWGDMVEEDHYFADLAMFGPEDPSSFGYESKNATIQEGQDFRYGPASSKKKNLPKSGAHCDGSTGGPSTSGQKTQTKRSVKLKDSTRAEERPAPQAAGTAAAGKALKSSNPRKGRRRRGRRSTKTSNPTQSC